MSFRIIGFLFFFCSFPAYAIMGRVDVSAFAGASEMSGFSNGTLKNYASPLVGYHAGVTANVALTSSKISPIIGSTIYRTSLTSALTYSGVPAEAKYESTTATANAGLRFKLPLVQLTVLGEYHFPLDQSFTLSQDLLNTGTKTKYYDGIADYKAYGITAMLNVKMLPFVSVGFGGSYRSQSFSIKGISSAGTSNITGEKPKEIALSGNISVQI